MQEFKIDDVVTDRRGGRKPFAVAEIGKRSYFNKGRTLSIKIEDAVKWEPNPGDVCWFDGDGTNHYFVGVFKEKRGGYFCSQNGKCAARCYPFSMGLPPFLIKAIEAEQRALIEAMG